MPGVASNSGDLSMATYSPEIPPPTVHSFRHGLKPPIAARLSISWSRGNTLRVTVLRPPSDEASDEIDPGGKVVEVSLSNGDGDNSHATWRRIVYGSVTPFAHLQSRRSTISNLSNMSLGPSPYSIDWWEYVMEYSKDVNSLLSSLDSGPDPVIDDPKMVLKRGEPTSIKVAWELMEIFYADKQSQPWQLERLADWLADYDSLLSSSHPTIHAKLVNFQNELSCLQVIEDDPNYWDVLSSALAVGWIDSVVKLLRLHGSYQHNQIGNREKIHTIPTITALVF